MRTKAEMKTRAKKKNKTAEASAVENVHGNGAVPARFNT